MSEVHEKCHGVWYGNGADVQVQGIFYVNIDPSEQSAQWCCVHGQKS
jgi:hypothetical protein